MSDGLLKLTNDSQNRFPEFKSHTQYQWNRRRVDYHYYPTSGKLYTL